MGKIEDSENGRPTPFAVIQNLIKIAETALRNIEVEVLFLGKYHKGGYNPALKEIRLWRSDAKMRKGRLTKKLEGK